LLLLSFLLGIVFNMHMWQATVQFCLLASAALPAVAASAWGFTDATVAVQPKGAGVNAGFKES
jgi:oligosaccharyltransferase complex subunit delta (ribophorin II)